MTPTPFLHFCDYLPFEEDLALYLNNLESHYLRMICTKFDWNWPSGSGEEDYPLYLNNLEFPPPKDDLCQVCLKLAKWFWRRSQKCKSLQTDGRTDRRTTDNGWSEKLTWAFSSGELKTSLIPNFFNSWNFSFLTSDLKFYLYYVLIIELH
jgi:hypothetical protein